MEPSNRPSPAALLLIHGAWQGAWAWSRLLPELEERGLSAVALDMPGNGFDETPPAEVTPQSYIDHVREAAEAVDGPVALVGHSGGGAIVTAAANAMADKVSHVIYIAGMLLPSGNTFDDIQDEVAGPGNRIGVTPHIRMSPDGSASTVAPADAIRFFFHDCAPEAAAEAAAKLTPQPTAGLRLRTTTGPEFERIAKLYVEATDDRSVTPAAQKAMQRGVPNLAVRHIDSGHAPQLSQPAHLAGILADFLSG